MLSNCDEPQGYTAFLDCDLCNFMCLSQSHLGVNGAVHSISLLEFHTQSYEFEIERRDLQEQQIKRNVD